MSNQRMAKVQILLPNGQVRTREESVSDYHGDEPDPEVKLAIEVYGKALKELANEDRRYLSNYNIWQRWDSDRRIRWINNIERQAQAGAETIGAVVVTRAAIIRLGE